MLVFLIGFMGSGKTTLGRSLAKQLGWHFIDLDKKVEQSSGNTIPELFAQFGEERFRMIEQEVLYDTVKQMQNCIIACGGGTPCYKENLTFMKENGFVIYLEVSPEILCERLLRAPEGKRPLLPVNHCIDRNVQTLHYICNLLDQRRPFYEAAHWKC